jgi:hypothetical protein
VELLVSRSQAWSKEFNKLISQTEDAYKVIIPVAPKYDAKAM